MIFKGLFKMPRKYLNPNTVKAPKFKTEEEEFGLAKSGMAICKGCGGYHYKKSWHHDAASFVAKREGKDVVMKFVLCPACQMIRNGMYEGIVTVENVSPNIEEELFNLVKSYCRKAFLRDHQDRLIAVKKEGKKIIITLTENQLAVKLAKKIGEVFNAEIKITYSKEPADTSFVKIKFS